LDIYLSKIEDDPLARSFNDLLQCLVHFGVHNNIAKAFTQNLTNICTMFGMNPKTELRRQSDAEWISQLIQQTITDQKTDQEASNELHGGDESYGDGNKGKKK